VVSAAYACLVFVRNRCGKIAACTTGRYGPPADGRVGSWVPVLKGKEKGGEQKGVGTDGPLGQPSPTLARGDQGNGTGARPNAAGLGVLGSPRSTGGGGGGGGGGPPVSDVNVGRGVPEGRPAMVGGVVEDSPSRLRATWALGRMKK